MFRKLRALLAAALVWGLAGAAAAQPPVWILHRGATTIVLFGSVHLLPPKLDWAPPRLTQAMARADDLWFEIPMDDAAALRATQVALAQGLEPPGVTLRGQLPPADQARLAALAGRYGVPVEGLDHLRPWLAEVTLSLAVYRQAGAAQAEGVERRLSALARPDLRRMAFETPEEQIGYLSGTSDQDQVASLEETLGELEQGPDSYLKLVKAWMSGDVAAIAAEAVDPLRHDAPGVYRALVADRNRRWLSRIEARLDQPGTAVMVVGVGHLVGPDSVPAMLRAAGVTVEGP